MNYTIKNESLALTVSTLGAEIISVVGADGFEYVWQNESGKFWAGHAPLLFPHCGRILNSEYTHDGKKYEMGIHGFARKCEFSLVDVDECSITLELSESEETKKIYPFDFKLTAEYKLEKNSIFANFTVQNSGKVELPFMFGWHPGFNLDMKNLEKTEDFYLDFGECEGCVCYPLQNGGFVAPQGYDYVLTGGKYRLSEEEMAREGTMIFVGTPRKCTLSADKPIHSVELSYSENLPYFCIWKWESPEAKYVCLEPWSSVPSDGVTPEDLGKKKMVRLAPSESEIYSYALKFGC